MKTPLTEFAIGLKNGKDSPFHPANHEKCLQALASRMTSPLIRAYWTGWVLGSQETTGAEVVPKDETGWRTLWEAHRAALPQAEPIKEAPAAGVTLTPCGNYAAQLPTGEFIAEQNGTQWKQDTAQGWSLCTTRKEAQNVADRYNRAAASKAAKA